MGMCVIEMLVGAHPIVRVLGPGATEQGVSQWISDRPVPLDGVEGRWRDLCGGLLTKDVDDRWGGVEVGRWLAGEDPEVRRPTPSDPVAVPVGVAPFVFGAVSGDGVEAYDDPRLLAHAFGVHWDEALEIVSGRGGAKRGEQLRLQQFVDELGLERAQGILRADGDDEARLVRLRLALDPGCEPVFRGVDLSGDGLRRLAARAARDDGRLDAERCSAMLDARVLSAHSAQPGRREWATVDAQWLVEDRYVTEWLARLPLAGLDDAARVRIRAQLLRAIVDSEGARSLHKRAEVVRADAQARSRPWFADLADQNDGHHGPALDLLVVAAHPTASRQADEEQRAAQAHAQQQAEQEQLEKLQRALASAPPLPRAGTAPELHVDARAALGWAVGGFIASFFVIGLVQSIVPRLTVLGVGVFKVLVAPSGAPKSPFVLICVCAALVAAVLGGCDLITYLRRRSNFRRAEAAFAARELERARIEESFSRESGRRGRR